MDPSILLPEDMHPGNTCFFTGHRFFSDEQLRKMYTPLVECILRMSEEGYLYFLNGGAMGFDLLCAETVALLRYEFQRDVRLVMALPCRDQTARWLYGKQKQKGLDTIRRYHNVKAMAQSVVYMADFYTEGCMKERNRFMAEHSSRCIAYWSGVSRGGTAQTVRMAEKAGMPVYNLYSPAD